MLLIKKKAISASIEVFKERDGDEDMSCLSGKTVCSFPNLCVLHVTRKKAAEVLQNRILADVKLKKKMNNRINVDPSATGISIFIDEVASSVYSSLCRALCSKVIFC